MDLAIPWLLEKAAEVDRDRADVAQAFVAPSWLTNSNCKRMTTVIKFLETAGSIGEEEARQAHRAVARLQRHRLFNPRRSQHQLIPKDTRESPSSATPVQSTIKESAEKVENAPTTMTTWGDSSKTPPAESGAALVGVNTADPGQRAVARTVTLDPSTPAQPPSQRMSSKGAKVAPSEQPSDSECECDRRAGSSRQRPPSRAASLGIPETALNRKQARLRRAESLALLAPVAEGGATAANPALVASLATELGEVMREATRTEAAVAAWWDVNLHHAGTDHRAVERELFVALAEELKPALLLAKAFVRL